MIVKVGDIVKIKIQGVICWARVTGYGMSYKSLNANPDDIHFVEVFDKPSWGIITIHEKDILEVFIPEEKVNFT